MPKQEIHAHLTNDAILLPEFMLLHVYLACSYPTTRNVNHIEFCTTHLNSLSISFLHERTNCLLSHVCGIMSIV
jgi:hypothetical protein